MNELLNKKFQQKWNEHEAVFEPLRSRDRSRRLSRRGQMALFVQRRRSRSPSGPSSSLNRLLNPSLDPAAEMEVLLVRPGH